MLSRSEYLLQRIALARAPGEADPWDRDDVEDVGLEVAEFLRDALDVAAYERELVGRSQLDGQALRWLADQFAALATSEPPPFDLCIGREPFTQLKWRDRLERLRNVVASLETPEQLEHAEVLLRLSLAVDSAADTLLAALPIDHPFKRDLERALVPKLALLSDADAMKFWAQLRFQVDPSREVHFDIDPAVIAPAFFDLGDADDVRPKIAQYLAVVRPALERRMFERGIDRVPGGWLSGIASILSWTRSASPSDWRAIDRAAIRGLARIALLWPGDKDELARALGVLREGYFLGGRGEQEERRRLDVGSRRREPRQGRLLDELTKLIRIAEQRRVRVEGSVERALRAFKLGLEVVAQDILPDGQLLRDELYAQRQLIRFLVERDIGAYGTKFGRSEVDIRAEDPFGAVVVEAKVLKGTLSESALNRYLTQLGSYMDESHTALRGVLVIFNFGATPILCPVMAVRYRFLLLAINLCEHSPSKRKAAIEIEEVTDGTKAVRLVKFGKEPNVTARKSSKRSRSSKAAKRKQSKRFVGPKKSRGPKRPAAQKSSTRQPPRPPKRRTAK